HAHAPGRHRLSQVAPAAQGHLPRAHRHRRLRRLQRRHLLQRHPRGCGGTARGHRAGGDPRYVCVEDCGVAINPQIVEGQCVGGIAQGIAGTLFEQVTYDAQGEPSATSFMDYKVPTAHEMPEVRLHHLQTPSAFTETGAKGAGEGGTIGAPAAVLNAVNDALRPTGVELDDTPITPETVHRALTAPA